MPEMDLGFSYVNEEEMGMEENMEREEVDRRNRREGKIMEKTTMTEEDLVRIVKKQKSGKAAWIDGVRAEVMKQMLENRSIRKSLTRACNLCLEEKVNRRWLESKTTMIAKTKKPKIKEHRPIAVTVCSSKIMCGFWREKIEEHLESWAYGYEQQYGFTSGGRV